MGVNKQWRTQKIFMGGFGSRSYGGYSFLVALFVTSQFDVISMFPNQRFGEVCWHSMHIFLHPLSLFYMSLHWIWTNIAPSKAIGEKQTQRYDTAVYNCKNNRLRVKTGEWNTLITTSEQFTTTKSGCANVSLNTGSWALKVCSWTLVCKIEFC